MDYYIMTDDASSLNINANENESVNLVSTTPVNTFVQESGGDNQVKVVISADLHKKIQDKINITYEKDVDDSIAARYTCRKTGHILEVISQILSLGSTILAFSAGFYDNKMLSFIAGCLGSLSFATLKTSTFALNESKERTTSLNKLLTQLNLGTIPEIVENTSA